MAVVALIACAAGTVVGLQRRSDSFRRLAAYHEQAAISLYVEDVGQICLDGVDSRADLNSIIKDRGSRAWLAFQAAEFHERQAKRCARVAERPWLFAATEPRPPLSYPNFKFDPSLAPESLGSSDKLDGGFR